MITLTYIVQALGIIVILATAVVWLVGLEGGEDQ